MSVLIESVDLEALTKIDGKQLKKCCELCIHNFKASGTDKKLFSRTAKELGMSTADVGAVVEGLSGFFLACCKKQLSQSNFNIIAKTLKLPDGYPTILYEFYVANVENIRGMLSKNSKRLPHYKSLNWRLELEMSSRSLHHEIRPSFLLEIETDDGVKEKSELMQCDFAVLKQFGSQLETALKIIIQEATWLCHDDECYICGFKEQIKRY
eukprot:jgi/Bigna1/91801/estExt_fgenesh1_pg.C_1200033